jgi:hypothetical protein
VTTHNGRQSPLSDAEQLSEQLWARLAVLIDQAFIHASVIRPSFRGGGPPAPGEANGRSDARSSGVPTEEDRLKNWFAGVSTSRSLNAPATGWWARDWKTSAVVEELVPDGMYAYGELWVDVGA